MDHFKGVIPKPGVLQPGEGSRAELLRTLARHAQDPFGELRAGYSLRLKNGCAQDDTLVISKAEKTDHGFGMIGSRIRGEARRLNHYTPAAERRHTMAQGLSPG